MIMRYLPGGFFILGGFVWMANNQGVIELPKLDWSWYGPALVMIAGVGLILVDGKIRQLKGRIVKRVGGIFTKIDSLYESSELSKGNGADSEYGELHEIIKLHANASPLYRASKLWGSLFVRHIRWLRESGISNFKRSG